MSSSLVSPPHGLVGSPPAAAPTASALAATGVATGSASRASRSRAGVHAAVGGFGWLLLALLWLWQVEARHVPSAWPSVVALVGAGAVAFGVLCVVWLRWNRNIYRRRHRRRAAIVAEVQVTADALGRRIVGLDERRHARHVIVDVDGSARVKHYRAAGR